MSDDMFASKCYTCRSASIMRLIDIIPGDGNWSQPKDYVLCTSYRAINPGYALVVDCDAWALKTLDREPVYPSIAGITPPPTPETTVPGVEKKPTQIPIQPVQEKPVAPRSKKRTRKPPSEPT